MGKDIPIIFSGPMVRALLDGRKTMTRRILKDGIPTAPGIDAVHPANKIRHDLPYFDAYCSERKSPENPRGMSHNWCWWTRDDRQCLPTINVKYAPGDRLWVRERAWFDKEVIPAIGCRRCFFEGGDVRFEDGRSGVTPGHPGAACEDVFNLTSSLKLRPSIHLPRWGSRLTLVVTGVKVERLNDISEADCFAEGVTGEILIQATGEKKPFGPAALMNFGALWEWLHGDGSWLANPFVVAITFRVIKANIDAPKAWAAA